VPGANTPGVGGTIDPFERWLSTEPLNRENSLSCSGGLIRYLEQEPECRSRGLALREKSLEPTTHGRHGAQTVNVGPVERVTDAATATTETAAAAAAKEEAKEAAKRAKKVRKQLSFQLCAVFIRNIEGGSR
jgi:hypothetical protein